MVVELFDVELAAFKAWWLTGSSTRRAESTCDEYIRQLRHWHEWAEQQGLTTLTIRSARAYVAEVRARFEWAAVGAVRALKAFSKWRSIDDPAVADELAELPYLARPDTTRTPVAELDDIQAVLDTCATSSLEDVRDRAIICLLRATGIMTRRGHRDLATAMCGGDHERSAPVGSALLLGHQPPVALLATWCDTRDFSHRNASASPNNRILPSARSVSATSMRSSEYDRPESAASCGRVHLRGADPR